MKLSIIIVNYNGKHFFDACLKSIAEKVTFEHEVIVVDNASADGSVEHLQSNYPDVKLIQSERNLGFAGGNNLGARYAEGRYLLLLNNDTILLNDLSSAVELMERDESVGILGARMLGKNFEYRHSAGYFPEPLRLIRLASLYLMHDGFLVGNFQSADECIPVDWIEGSFLLTPIEVWHQLGGLDETYFMYIEDVDYARRVMKLGKRTVYFPKMSYIHFGGFNRERIGMLVNGLRKYHEAHSGFIKKQIANLILDAGLVLKGLLSLGGAVVNRSKFSQALLFFRALKRH